MKKFVSKTTYIDYLKCSRNAWLRLHKKHELQDYFSLSDVQKAIIEKGNLVELVARKLFPEGILIKGSLEKAICDTKGYVDKTKLTLFQSTFTNQSFITKNDVLQYDPQSGKWNLYEIKGNNSIKEKRDEIDHIEDVSFQSIILKDNGIELENVFIIHLNKDYCRQEELIKDALFSIVCITDKVKIREAKTRDRMKEAKRDLLNNDVESTFCNCIHKGRSSHCETFKYSYPKIPEYSIHDIARITTKKLEDLSKQEIIDIKDIPDFFALTPIQKKQVETFKFQKPIIKKFEIKEEIKKLTYPLYFLDYESYSHPIPLFQGFKPFQQIPFQFSLYVLDSPDSSLKHFEYLHTSKSDPSIHIIQKLKKLIGEKGSILVWHKSFEEKINQELGERYPSFKNFFENINSRLYDLEKIFIKQMYVHPLFRGKTSIKNILPVLNSHYSYEHLPINDGALASEKWFAAINDEYRAQEKNKIMSDLSNYCKLDTLGIYKILKRLLLDVV